MYIIYCDPCIMLLLSKNNEYASLIPSIIIVWFFVLHHVFFLRFHFLVSHHRDRVFWTGMVYILILNYFNEHQ